VVERPKCDGWFQKDNEDGRKKKKGEVELRPALFMHRGPMGATSQQYRTPCVTP